MRSLAVKETKVDKLVVGTLVFSSQEYWFVTGKVHVKVEILNCLIEWFADLFSPSVGRSHFQPWGLVLVCWERERERFLRLLIYSIDVLTVFLKWIILEQPVIREQQLKSQRTRVELTKFCFITLEEPPFRLDSFTSLFPLFNRCPPSCLYFTCILMLLCEFNTG